MPVNKLPESSPVRLKLVTAALRLVTISVAFGVLSGAVLIVTGLQDHSPGVFAIGFGVLADVTGSAVLIWRFRAERRHPGQSGTTETRAAIVVSIALAVVSTALVIGSAAALASGSHPGTSGVTGWSGASPVVPGGVSPACAGPQAAVPHGAPPGKCRRYPLSCSI